MRTPAEWHEQSQLTRAIAENETDPHLKRLLARHALALAKLAEKIRRDEAVRKKAAAA